MKKVTVALLSVLVMAIALPALGQARPGPFWHGGIEHFHEHDIVVWRGGRWFHGWHGSRIGWWWIVGPHGIGIRPRSIPIQTLILLR